MGALQIVVWRRCGDGNQVVVIVFVFQDSAVQEIVPRADFVVQWGFRCLNVTVATDHRATRPAHFGDNAALRGPRRPRFPFQRVAA